MGPFILPLAQAQSLEIILDSFLPHPTCNLSAILLASPSK